MKQPGIPIIETLSEEHTREAGTLSVDRAGHRLALPLAGHRILARVADRVADVSVEQLFRNPYPEPLAAVYIFPLGGGAAVSAFEMKVAGRTLKGIVKERGAARLDYRKALDEGKRAGLLEQERDDIFTVQVGNLPPGEEVSIRIVYSELLPYFEDGATELRLPLVVAPRYVPGQPLLDGDAAGAGVAFDTDAVPDASRISPPRLAPGLDPKVALSIEVELAGGAVADVACSQHAVKVANGRVALSREDEPLDRDFVLRWRLVQDAIQPRLLITRDGCAMLSLIPPRRDGLPGAARDVIFVIDRSGSMSGVKMASAARACSILLATLGPRDNFAMCAFDNTTEWLHWTRADQAGIAAGDKFLRALSAQGGTELDPAFDETFAEIRARSETTGRVPVIVLVTDGQIGNEAQILKRVQQDDVGARVFTVGIDTAVNAAFLQRLAALGGGACTCCAPGEALVEALASVSRDIGAPVVTGLRIDDADLAAPSRTPDLFAGRASTSFFVGRDLKSVRVRGTCADGAAFDLTVKAEEIDLPAIAHLWARTRVADLEDRFRLGENVKAEIIDLAVKHTLLTRFTAFVVVDESEIVNKDGRRRTVVQPVEMPDRWEMRSEFSLLERGFTELDEMSALHALLPIETKAGLPPPGAVYCSTSLGNVRTAAGGRIPGKVARIHGSRKPVRPAGLGEDFIEAEPPSNKADRAAIEKAIAELSETLKDARRALEGGAVPSSKPIEKARQSLMQTLAAATDVRFAALQKFLRSTVVELIAAFANGSSASVRPILDRAIMEFDRVTRQQNFWETSV